MIDCERWVLAEAWLSNGLRLCWAYSGQRTDDTWQDDSDSQQSYRYRGYGEWEVIPPRGYMPLGRDGAPSLSTGTMRHELAHWITSTEEQRGLQNFGLTKTDNEREADALTAERILESITKAAARIASMALGASAR